MSRVIFLLLSLLLGGFQSVKCDRRHSDNGTLPTTPSSPTKDTSPDNPDALTTSKGKSVTTTTAAEIQNQLLQNFNQSQPISSFVLRMKLPDLSNQTVVHAHLHEDRVSRTNMSITEVALGESGYFIHKIFQKYGISEKLLTFKGLRALMTHIGLVVGIDEDDNVNSMRQKSEDDETAQGKERSGGKSMAGRTAQNVQRGTKKRRRSVHEPIVIAHSHGDHSQCHALGDLLSAFHFDLLTDLDPNQFLLLCPALIDQLDNRGCHRHDDQQHHRHHGSLQHDHDDQPSDHDHPHPATPSNHASHPHDRHDDNTAPVVTSLRSDEPKGIPVMVWVFSFVAVVAISLVGLLGVAVIPILRGRLYKVLLQFLIALAVGALSGDALLHLLPHALSPAHPTGDANHDHSDQVNTTASGHQDKGGDDHGATVYKGLVALLGLLFFFLAERLLTIVTARRSHLREKRRAKKKRKLLEMSSDVTEDITIIVPSPSDDTEETAIRETAILSDDDQMDQVQLDDTADQQFLSDNNHNHDHHHHQPEGPSSDHGHGHSHGEVPTSMSAVALMVIFGDGIHNFSDGLAIGAAFANSITGGLSTAVAVFCHELPHEIGDFAMLLSAGMTWRRAMLYNMLSSVLCLMGMVIGVFLGNLDNAVLWIFPAVAGMFLYISLADMLPALALGKERMGRQLLTQCAGIALGAGIMLLIAIFEHDLKTMLD